MMSNTMHTAWCSAPLRFDGNFVSLGRMLPQVCDRAFARTVLIK